MPDLLVQRHGGYQLVHGTAGWEVREEPGASPRRRRLVAAAILALAAVLYLKVGTAVALPAVLVGFGIGLPAVRRRRKVLVLGDTELRYGPENALHEREGAWPLSAVERVLVARRGGDTAGVHRARQPGPFYVVHIARRDGALHPARFIFRSRDTAMDLAAAIADRLGVPVENGIG